MGDLVIATTRGVVAVGWPCPYTGVLGPLAVVLRELAFGVVASVAIGCPFCGVDVPEDLEEP